MSRMKPNDVIAHAADTLRTLTTAKLEIPAPAPGEPDAKRKTIALEELLRRARHVVACASVASTTIDGYPTKTPGATEPGALNVQAHPCPEPGCGHWTPCPIHEEPAPKFTSVEAAGNARLAGRQPDPVSVIAQQILRALTTAAGAMQTALNAADRFDNLRDTARIADAPQCWWATTLGLPWDEAWTPTKRTDFARNIDEPFDEIRPVSTFVYWFPRNTKLRRLPTKAEMLRHLERGTVNVTGAA